MRIVLFPSAYAPAVGGVEELTRRLAEQLASEGDVVEVWTHRFPESLPATDVIAGTAVRRMPLPLPRADVHEAARFPAAAGRSLRDLVRAARAVRPQVVHVQCFSGNGVYATALSRLLGIPMVVTLQGETVMDDADIYDHSAALRAGLRVGLRTASAVTGCSQFVLDDARERFGLDPARATVIPNGVQEDGSARLVPLALPFERFVLGLGRVVEKKGFDLLLGAFAHVANAQPDLGLVIAGDGPVRGELAGRAAALGLEGRVTFPGTLDRGQVEWAMSNAAVFVLPSRVEPFGIVVLEAMRSGCAVVVSSHGGAPEIVHDGHDGLVVDPCDTSALAGAIHRLLTDADLRCRLGEAAAQRARAFSWDLVASRYREIYRRVLATRAGGDRAG